MQASCSQLQVFGTNCPSDPGRLLPWNDHRKILKRRCHQPPRQPLHSPAGCVRELRCLFALLVVSQGRWLLLPRFPRRPTISWTSSWSGFLDNHNLTHLRKWKSPRVHKGGGGPALASNPRNQFFIQFLGELPADIGSKLGVNNFPQHSNSNHREPVPQPLQEFKDDS